MPEDIEKLKTENSQLRFTITELENTSKLLLRRDMDLRRAYDALKEVDREKSEFVSIAAHQLRTPLTGVRFANQMLYDALFATLAPEHQQVLTQARRGIDVMFEMIEDLLIIDALDYGNLKLDKTTFSVEDLIREILEDLKEHVEKKHITLTTSLNAANCQITVDRRRIKDVFSNLIDNAVKYTPANGSVSVRTECIDNMVIVTVSDTGIGVDPAKAENLFKKFSRLDNARRIDANGSGLGLYITKKIAEAHGGRVAYAPNQPTGSSFTVTIPV